MGSPLFLLFLLCCWLPPNWGKRPRYIDRIDRSILYPNEYYDIVGNQYKNKLTFFTKFHEIPNWGKWPRYIDRFVVVAVIFKQRNVPF